MTFKRKEERNTSNRQEAPRWLVAGHWNDALARLYAHTNEDRFEKVAR